MYRNGLVCIIIFLFVCTGFVSAFSVNNIFKTMKNGNWLYVGGYGEGNYTKIQDAIDNATDGDTVFVFDDSSPYHEEVYINKRINLIGENKSTTIIDGNGCIDLIRVDSLNVNISGFTVQNGFDHGIFISKLNADNLRVTIHDTIITGQPIGIMVYGHNTEIYNNIIFNNSNVGIHVTSCYCVIHDNLIMNNGNGICLLNVERYNCDIYQNIIQENNYGVFSMEAAAKVQKNNFINNSIQAEYWKIINDNNMVIRATRWRNNYWDDWISPLPRPVKGSWFYISILFHKVIGPIPVWLYFDWHPAQEPYDIPIEG